MADLSRTFASSGESDSKAPPETSIDIPPSITPVMEFCRPVIDAPIPANQIPQDSSVMQSVAITVAAGGPAASAPLFRLRRGVWRISMQASLSVVGAIPTVDNYAILALLSPSGSFFNGLNLLQSSIGTAQGSQDFLIHLPNDDYDMFLEIADPVTALSSNRFRGSVYACHLL
jgi:hypothetical protein